MRRFYYKIYATVIIKYNIYYKLQQYNSQKIVARPVIVNQRKFLFIN